MCCITIVDTYGGLRMLLLFRPLLRMISWSPIWSCWPISDPPHRDFLLKEGRDSFHEHTLWIRGVLWMMLKVVMSCGIIVSFAKKSRNYFSDLPALIHYFANRLWVMTLLITHIKVMKQHRYYVYLFTKCLSYHIPLMKIIPTNLLLHVQTSM